MKRSHPAEPEARIQKEYTLVIAEWRGQVLDDWGLEFFEPEPQCWLGARHYAQFLCGTRLRAQKQAGQDFLEQMLAHGYVAEIIPQSGMKANN